MKRDICLIRHSLFWVYLIAIVFFSANPRAFATAGVAEWSIQTPMGNEINHGDPFIGQYGTSIRTAGAFDSDTPFVDRLQSWTFYLNYVVGQSEKGFFIFNEATKEVEYFKNQVDQK